MRFPQLPLGARFVFQGKVYSKTSALLASAEDGSGQRIIPKYADMAPAVSALAGLKGLKLRGRTVLHTSGVHSAAALAPLRKAGASIASFHPLQTFPRGTTIARLRASVRGIYFAMDGDDAAVDVARKLAADLGGKPLDVPAEMRPVYHAAGRRISRQ